VDASGVEGVEVVAVAQVRLVVRVEQAAPGRRVVVGDQADLVQPARPVAEPVSAPYGCIVRYAVSDATQ